MWTTRAGIRLERHGGLVLLDVRGTALDLYGRPRASLWPSLQILATARATVLAWSGAGPEFAANQLAVADAHSPGLLDYVSGYAAKWDVAELARGGPLYCLDDEEIMVRLIQRYPGSGGTVVSSDDDLVRGAERAAAWWHGLRKG